ncbi:hypothetical protein SASPL_101305 [Salvia splendens]|uniref:Uncharacterized protein n=1 Tax=Salvia splendens TaxID=180675 RepID=A0A8X9ABT1_SALSN|nr:hypothetical protein SASPL_101305 [Salvia splendens]
MASHRVGELSDSGAPHHHHIPYPIAHTFHHPNNSTFIFIHRNQACSNSEYVPFLAYEIPATYHKSVNRY